MIKKFFTIKSKFYRFIYYLLIIILLFNVFLKTAWMQGTSTRVWVDPNLRVQDIKPDPSYYGAERNIHQAASPAYKSMSELSQSERAERKEFGMLSEDEKNKEPDRGFFENLVIKLVSSLVEILAVIVKWVGWMIFHILMYVNLNWVAPITDNMIYLSPFDTSQGQMSPAEQIWFILKNFSYLILVFSALAAGFQWILGEDNNAKSLIFNIIIIALLIDFTFLFIKEAFSVVRAIEDGITGEIELRDANNRVTTSTASSKLGTLIAAAAWSMPDPREKIDEIVSNNIEMAKTAAKVGKVDEDVEAIKNSFIALGVSLFFVTFAMIIFIVLVVMAAIGLARYLILTFLTSVSAFAVASLAFPRFKPPLDALTSMVSGTFDGWLKHVVSWLLVIPVFAIMMILGLVIQKSFLGITNVASLNEAVQFVLALIIIVGWFILSLYIAVQTSGKVGETAQGFAVNALKYTGVAPVRLLTSRPFAGTIGSMLERAGGALGRGAGMSWLGRIRHAASKYALRTAEGWKQKGYGGMAEVAGDRLKDAYSRLARAKTDEEKEKAVKNLMGVINEIKARPEVARLSKEAIKQISGLALQRIADNKEVLQEFMTTVSSLDAETQEGIVSRLDRSSAEKILKYMKDGNFVKQIAGLTPVLLNGLASKIAEINPQDIIDLLQDNDFRNNLVTNSDALGPVIGALNKATRGLYDGLVKKNIELVANALAKLPSEVFRNGGSLIELINREIPGKTAEILNTVISANKTEFFNGFKKAMPDEKKTMIRFLNDFFKRSPNVLQSMVSEEDISFLEALIQNARGTSIEQTLRDNLTDRQIDLLGMKRSTSQTGGGAKGGGANIPRYKRT